MTPFHWPTWAHLTSPNLSHLDPWGNPLPSIDTYQTLCIHFSPNPEKPVPYKSLKTYRIYHVESSVPLKSTSTGPIKHAHDIHKCSHPNIIEHGWQSPWTSGCPLPPQDKVIVTLDHCANKVLLVMTSITLDDGCTTLPSQGKIYVRPPSSVHTSNSTFPTNIPFQRRWINVKQASFSAPLPRDECIKDLDQIPSRSRTWHRPLHIDANETPSKSCNTHWDLNQYWSPTPVSQP